MGHDTFRRGTNCNSRSVFFFDVVGSWQCTRGRRRLEPFSSPWRLRSKDTRVGK